LRPGAKKQLFNRRGADERSNSADLLRQRAENMFHEQRGQISSPRPEENQQKLLHELQVHQIELEIQNEELRQSRSEVEALLETYSDLYDFAPVGYVSLDRSGKIHSANLTGAGLLGVDRSALISRRFKQFVARTQHSAFSSFLENVFASQLKTSCELAVQNGGAANRYFQIEAISAASGETCRVAFIDISLRKQLEKQNEIQRAELAIANIELEAFNYTVTHDLRMPLTIIHGYCQVLKDLCGCQLDEQSRGFLEEIFNGSLRMSRLITTLLKFSHVTHTEMHRKAVDLSAMAKAVVAELNLAMPGLRVRFQIDDQILGNGDPNLLRVVLNNLLGNAWKYAGRQDGAVVEFGMREFDGKPAFFVKDNGPGFDMADAKLLFIPFQRLPDASLEGHGIGLATVDRIVRRHGGRIWAESEPDKGANFLFTLE
jgi:signal transduction histidine kinase